MASELKSLKRIHVARIVLLLLYVFALGPVLVHASSPRYVTSLNDIATFSAALELYKDDTGSYPADDVGLEALLPSTRPVPGAKSDGYVKHLSRDPWGFKYEYRYPGTQNLDGFDLWSNGADGKVGGDGNGTDCGNWIESRKRCADAHAPPTSLEDNLFFAVMSALTGAVVGLPLYLFGVYWHIKFDSKKYKGFHLGALVYLILLGPLIVLCVSVYRYMEW